MDIEMEMNGHATNFGTHSEQDEVSYNESNTAAVISNSEDLPRASSLKPGVESFTAPPVQPPEPATDRDSAATALDTFVPPEPESILAPVESVATSLPTASQPINGTSLQSEVSDADSAVAHPAYVADEPQPQFDTFSTSPSFPSAAQSSLAVNQVLQSSFAPPSHLSEVATEMTSGPDQATISDLRTSPPAQPLSSETTQRIQSEKEQQDLAADSELAQQLSADSSDPVPRTMPTASLSPLPPATPTSPPPQHQDEADAMDTSFEAPPIADIKLPSPPAQSPPPAPQLAPAKLPVDPPSDALPSPAPISVIAEQPHDPAPSLSSESVPQVKADVDQVMTDVASPPTKVAREREDDDNEAEPSAKRTKTAVEPEPATFKVPDMPLAHSPAAQSPAVQSPAVQSPAAQSGGDVLASVKADEDQTVTPPRLAHMKKILSNLKKGNSSLYFRNPVDFVQLNIPNYPTVIRQPMDLGTIDLKLKNQEYATLKSFIDDFELIVNNSATFNGLDHAVTQAALKMQTSFNNQILHMPNAGVAEPSKEEKKALKAKIEPTRNNPTRRQSVTSRAVSGSARSPSVATPAQTFAVGPEGVPLIRRDSNINDGRPKRAIHPPKRNSELGGGRPRKKKYELELKFCDKVLKELQSPTHWSFAQYFYHPVDPVALNIPTYFSVIKKPMDLGTVQTGLENNQYEKAKDFEDDVRLIFRNCFNFNSEGEFVNTCGHQLEALFDKEWKKKEEWLAKNEVKSEPQSPADDEDEDDDESEEEEDDEEDDRAKQIAELQKQIAQMSQNLGALVQAPKKKKKPTPPAPAKKAKGGKKEKAKATKEPPAKDKKKSAAKTKEANRFVSYSEKQYISNGISQLPDKQMMEALRIIQNNVPHLKDVNEAEIELDIDELPQAVLWKLLAFVKKYVGPPPDEVKAETYSAPPVATKPKKNKPMSKTEQEAQIAELKGKLGGFNHSGPESPNSMQPSIENEGESSDDEADSEESEEE